LGSQVLWDAQSEAELLQQIQKFPKRITMPNVAGWPKQKNHAKISIACTETPPRLHSDSLPNMLPVGLN
jgi:hypothetical protein